MNILITGAGSGIGYDTALELSNNHNVIALVKSKQDLIKFENYPKINAHICDITSNKDIESIANHKIDVLINNAAIGESGPVDIVPINRIRKIVDTNIIGMISMIQAFSPHMKSQKSGRIINISSVAGKIAIPYLGIYSMTKFAVEALSDSLRQELALFDIFVSVIEPGAIATGFNEKMISSKEDWLAKSRVTKQEISIMKKKHSNLIKDQADTRSVVLAIVDAVNNPKPKSRYIVPKKYNLMVKLSSCLPDKVRDFFLSLT